MRRFASLFAKRDKQPPPPPLVTDHAHSSASSSSGSTSLYLHTPDDDHTPVIAPSNSKTWKSWLRSTSKHKNDKKHTHSSIPHWSQRDDAQFDPSLDDEHTQLPLDDPRNSLKTLVRNSLVPLPTPPPPFAHRSDAPSIFPRSVNLASTLRPSHSLAVTLLKTRLLASLREEDPPSPTKQYDLTSLTSRRVKPLVPLNPPPHPFNDPLPSSTMVVTLSSPGLARWISRPCFEDRYDVFIPEQDGSVSRHRVLGTGLAVAALEYSEAFDSMVDFNLIQIPPSLAIEIPSTSPPETISPTSSSGHNARSSPYIAVPSPLRNEHNLPSPMAVTTTHFSPQSIDEPADPLVKRGVRFAEDDKDDVIPLGYVLRMKKKREEKARFLRAEQQRRLLEEEEEIRAEARRKRDAERAEWENERRAWEREKRAMEEEKKQRKYADEVIAARMRRESQRAGFIPGHRTENNNVHDFLGINHGGGAIFPPSASSSASGRNKSPPTRNHRPVYNDGSSPINLPRREASEPNLSARTASFPVMHHTSPRGSANSHSPGSSRPPSVRDTPPSAENSSPSPLSGTRPPSAYSSQEFPPSSSEDVKAAVAAAASRAKRNSLAASTSRNNSSSSLSGDRTTSYPMWTGSNLSLNNAVPPVPMIPMPMQMQMMPMPALVMMDMPLLPPTPPFMMQQYPRQHGPLGSSGSAGGSSKARLSSSQNSSRERVYEAGRSGSAEGTRGHPPRSASFPRPEALVPAPTAGTIVGSPYNSSSHSHRSGNESTERVSSRRASMPPPSHHEQQRPRQSSHHEHRRPPPTHSQSQPPLLSRGPPSQLLQPPSPWTGIPTESGKLPSAHAIPTSPRNYSQSSFRMMSTTAKQAKRQTMIT